MVLAGREQLREFLRLYPRLLVITGAGISVGSGIPAYRDHRGSWQHSEPIQHRDFIDQPAQRRRYWTRSARGWPPVSRARPNNTHFALAELERRGHVAQLITQNVDRLHQRAGHHQVVDLHGRLDRVRCLNCGEYEGRDALQRRLLATNRQLVSDIEAPLAPDGDAAVEDALCEQLVEPVCLQCGGVIMPDVVFFGGTVPRERVQLGLDSLREVDGLLVVGSSLMVYSGFRYCRAAAAAGLPIAAINRGVTRADALLQLKIEVDCGAVLHDLLS